jgi:hypothetical protein
VFAFLLRPFGVKGGIDFDLIERELVQPALSTLNIESRKSASIAGDLRAGLFEALLTADVVVADVSVPNPNVFYELGLAHALRDKRTLVIAAEQQPVTFDIASVHYVRYDPEKPSASIPRVVEALRAAIDSDRVDSPVYSLLPGLQRPRPTLVPESFTSELTASRRTRDAGHLRLLAEEARRFHWAANALDRVSVVQVDVRDMSGARETLEYLLTLTPNNADVQLQLGTVYQRLREPRRSDAAIKRALESFPVGSPSRAEALALLGRNAKTVWLDSWRSRPAADWRAEALRHAGLKDAYDYYRRAFKQDLNSFYSGLNALALGKVVLALAPEMPDIWSALFEDDADAAVRLTALEKEVSALSSGVALSLEAAEERRAATDPWLEISKADFDLLTSNRPTRVAEKYRRASSGATPFVADSALNQIYIYRDLGVLKDNVDAAIAALEPSRSQTEIVAQPVRKALLFVGHAIDRPDQQSPRFPPSAEMSARNAIVRAIDEAAKDERSVCLGVAGASSGGDILFHEACESLGIANRICLAVPPAEYARLDVADAGTQWEARFRDLISRQPYQVLSESTELPLWLRGNAPYGFWDRDTMWRYHTAAAIGDITVIALWDGKAGAAGDMVKMAKERGAKVIVLDALSLPA